MSTTKQQPEALRLAESLGELDYCFASPDDCADAAAELRRLHAANVDCMAWYESIKADYDKLKAGHEALRKAVIKLHAAKGRYHTQIAACDLYDLLGLKNERPTK